MNDNIDGAINTYFGNYCVRKCFNHMETINSCENKFELLKKQLSQLKITRKEFNTMMKEGKINICKLPYEKRKLYISWQAFEKLLNKNTDFWDILEEEECKKSN